MRENEIGRGGFGIVYRVTRTTKVGEFEFAMKVLDPSPFNTNVSRNFERFMREMNALKKLQHKGIVAHLEAGVDGDQKPYILMPFIAGKDLGQYLSGASLKRVFDAFGEILLAIQYAHDNHVLHRDLKPSNILVRSSDDQPIILDFGAAYLMDEVTQTQLTTTLIGSAAYIPSEVIADPTHHTHKQDVYACGVLLYQMIAGEFPDRDDFTSVETTHHCPGLDDLILRAIAPEKSRIESAAIFRDQLLKLL